MELHSTSDPMLLLKYLNTKLPTNQNPHLYTNDHHCTAYISQHSIIMPSPYSNTSFFEDPSDIEMDDLSLPKQALTGSRNPYGRSDPLSNMTVLLVKETPWYSSIDIKRQPHNSQYSY